VLPVFAVARREAPTIRLTEVPAQALPWTVTVPVSVLFPPRVTISGTAVRRVTEA
jgi:hypothetical protein